MLAYVEVHDDRHAVLPDGIVRQDFAQRAFPRVCWAYYLLMQEARQQLMDQQLFIA